MRAQAASNFRDRGYRHDNPDHPEARATQRNALGSVQFLRRNVCVISANAQQTATDFVSRSTKLQAAGSIDAGIEQYRTALQLDPNDAIAHYNLGTALAKKSNTDGAINEYRSALQIDPNHADSHYNLEMCSCRRETRKAARLSNFRKRSP